MNIFPAIDLRGGHAVRLVQGDYRQETIFSDDPPAVAADCVRAGAESLHAVDLDGARDGTTPTFGIVTGLCRQGLKVEVGGGVRSEETLLRYLGSGAFRVILGSSAVTDPDFAGEMIAKYGDRVAVGLDLRDGLVAVHGWQETTQVTSRQMCDQLVKWGCSTLIVTDISRDGMLGGTNIALYEGIKRQWPEMALTASGGISSLEDVRALKEAGVDGAIVGKAFYTGMLDLKQAIEAAK